MKTKMIRFLAYLSVICASSALLGGIILRLNYNMKLYNFIATLVGAIFLFFIAIALDDIASNFKKIEKMMNQEKEGTNTPNQSDNKTNLK